MTISKFSSGKIHRRQALQAAVGSMLGISSCGWLPQLASAAIQRKSGRHCILLWMSGGPSQIDTFDLKPNHVNGGPFQEIRTTVPSVRISEHLPKLAAHADDLAILRGVSTKEGDHSRGTYLMRTGRRPGTPVRYPTIGSALSKELGRPWIALPNYVSINPSPQINPDAFAPGFLGPKYAAATVGGQPMEQAAIQQPPNQFAEMRVENLTLPDGVSIDRAAKRHELWSVLQNDFKSTHNAEAIIAQDTIYRKAFDVMTSEEVSAFDLSKEPDDVRAAYGNGQFGQGCLVARRLIERGVPFVEVTLGNGLAWDTHQNNFDSVRQLSQELDNGWAMLMTELKQRDLLKITTILWMGEFGRTPQINSMQGRDHFPNAWSCVFAGGGINGGQTFGATSDDGMEVKDGQVSESDIMATLCNAVGVDPQTENFTPQGRPHKICEGSSIDEVLS